MIVRKNSPLSSRFRDKPIASKSHIVILSLGTKPYAVLLPAHTAGSVYVIPAAVAQCHERMAIITVRGTNVDTNRTLRIATDQLFLRL